MTVTIKLGSGNNQITLSYFDTLTSGSGSDTVVLTGTVSGSVIDLGAGADNLTLADGGNTITVSNTETIIGGSGADIVTLG